MSHATFQNLLTFLVLMLALGTVLLAIGTLANNVTMQAMEPLLTALGGK